MRLNLNRLELHLISRGFHLLGRNNPVGHRWWRHHGLFDGFSRPHSRQTLFQVYGSYRWGLLRGNLPVVIDPGQYFVMWLLGHIHIREVVFVSDLIVIIYDSLV